MGLFDFFKLDETSYSRSNNVFEYRPKHPQFVGGVYFYTGDLHGLNPRKVSYYGEIASVMLKLLTGPVGELKSLMNNACHRAVEMEYEVSYQTNVILRQIHRVGYEHWATNMGLPSSDWNRSDVTDAAIDAGLIRPFYTVHPKIDRPFFLLMGLVFESFNDTNIQLKSLINEYQKNGSRDFPNVYKRYKPKLDERKSDIDWFKKMAIEFLIRGCTETRPSGYTTIVNEGAFGTYYASTMNSFIDDVEKFCHGRGLNFNNILPLATNETKESVSIDFAEIMRSLMGLQDRQF
jgi:hypothetical protein